MNDITVIVLTKNEEGVLAECLKSLNFIDKKIVIDSGSVDQTIEIAKQYKAIVIEHTFQDFSETRNYAFNLVKTKWVLYIDADERITSQLRDSIVKAIRKPLFTAYSFKRKNYYFGREWPYKEIVTRLFLRDKLKSWQGILHESPQISGKTQKIPGELLHNTHRNLEQMINKTIEWSEYEAKLRFKVNHPKVTWWRLIRVYLTGFINSYIHQQGYRVGTIGLIESIYQGFSLFITYVRLWEMQKNQK